MKSVPWVWRKGSQRESGHWWSSRKPCTQQGTGHGSLTKRGQGTVGLWTQWLDIFMESTGFPGPAYHPEFHGLNFFTFHHFSMLLLWLFPPSFSPGAGPHAQYHYVLLPRTIRIQLKEASSRNRGLEQRKRLGCSLAYLTVTCLVQPSTDIPLGKKPQ